MNAPATFQWMATKLLGVLDFVRVYIDNVVISTSSIAEHTLIVNVVCERVRRAGLKLESRKCVFLRK